MMKKTRVELGLTKADVQHIAGLVSILNSKKVGVAKAAEMVADLSDAMFGSLSSREFERMRRVSERVTRMSLEK